MTRARLLDCDFTGVEASGLRCSQSDCGKSEFAESNLTGADFREANLQGARFFRTKLENVRFGGAKIFGADFRGSDMQGARDLTQEQLCMARTDDKTLLPSGARGPFLKGSGAEKPRGMRGT